MKVVHSFADERSLTLVGRDDQGKRVMRQLPAEYVVYLAVADLDDGLRQFVRGSRWVKSMRLEGDWVRVGFVSRGAREDFCQHVDSPIRQMGVPTYEGDVSPVLRHAVDTALVGAAPRRVYLDLETDSRVPFSRKLEMRILSWALIDERGRCHVGVLEEESDRAERQLLDRLWVALEPYDQVIAWNGDGFDFPVLEARTRARGCPVDMRLWLWLDHLLLFQRMNLNAAESGEEKESMRLNDIAHAILGEGKEETPPEVEARFGNKSLGALSWQLWEAGGAMRETLVRYNIRDTDLLRRIEEATGYVALFQTLCEVCHLFGDTRSLNPTLQMDGFMLRLGLERRQHFPTRVHREVIAKYKGAFVMEPRTKGIERNVHVCDFASLYPSIILSWNMSPDTKAGVKFCDPIPEGACRSPLTGVCFRTGEEGILPQALGELIRLRKVWSEKQAAEPPGTDAHHDARRKSMAYKVAANSFYGVMGSPFSRFFDREIAESITQNGVWLLEETIKAAEARGLRAVYGDTDSVFVQGGSREEFAAFVAWCNEVLYPQRLREVGCQRNAIKLAYEKAFDVLVMTTAKRYIGRYAHYKGKDATADSKPEIKGLEYKRGDALALARRLQSEVIDLLCGGLGVVKGVVVPTQELAHFHRVLSELQNYLLDASRQLPLEQVRVSKAISRPLKDYVQKIKKDGTPGSQPPHVVVAKLLAARGEDVSEGTRIEYVVADGSKTPVRCIPASDYTGVEADRYYLWEHVFAPTQRLLEAAFPGEDWAKWAKVRPPKAPAKRGRAATAEAAARVELGAALPMATTA